MERENRNLGTKQEKYIVLHRPAITTQTITQNKINLTQLIEDADHQPVYVIS